MLKVTQIYSTLLKATQNYSTLLIFTQSYSKFNSTLLNFTHFFFRLAVNFAPSRASSKQTGNIFHRQSKSKMTESLFVMASHGVLLEYTLEPLPDVTTKDNICESR